MKRYFENGLNLEVEGIDTTKNKCAVSYIENIISNATCDYNKDPIQERQQRS